MQIAILFLLILISTFLITRLSAHILHDREGYMQRSEKSKTLTGKIRKKTGIDIHHIHIGILVLILTLVSITIQGITSLAVMAFAISISLIIDQIIPLVNEEISYFSKQSLVISIISHIIIGIVGYIVFTTN